jgi:hypothetical protein
VGFISVSWLTFICVSPFSQSPMDFDIQKSPPTLSREASCPVPTNFSRFRVQVRDRNESCGANPTAGTLEKQRISKLQTWDSKCGAQSHMSWIFPPCGAGCQSWCLAHARQALYRWTISSEPTALKPKMKEEQNKTWTLQPSSSWL